MSAFEYADLALQHFQFAGVLALNFALVTVVYLAALWRLTGRIGRVPALVLHTLFFGWQSNVAYLAVATLRAGRQCLEQAGPELTTAWSAAPWLVPGAAVLYTSVLLLCVGFAVGCAGRPGIDTTLSPQS